MFAMVDLVLPLTEPDPQRPPRSPPGTPSPSRDRRPPFTRAARPNPRGADVHMPYMAMGKRGRTPGSSAGQIINACSTNDAVDYPGLTALPHAVPSRQGGGRWFEPSIAHSVVCSEFLGLIGLGPTSLASRVRPARGTRRRRAPRALKANAPIPSSTSAVSLSPRWEAQLSPCGESLFHGHLLAGAPTRSGLLQPTAEQSATAIGSSANLQLFADCDGGLVRMPSHR